MDEQQAAQERRVAPRRRVLKAAKIFVNDGASVYDCTVHDVSATGARLSMGIFQVLPKQFRLVVNDLGGHLCELVRIAGNEYGVRFIGLAA
ncbi:MAG TPA: PilZ domain-containing protein [Terriglobia bacterium]|nr:PilZ domain-containing protein [Terriglobia bacterium]